MARIKGTALRGVLHYVKGTGGSIPELIASLPAESRDAFEAPIIASGWYPYGAYVSLLEALNQKHEQKPGDLTLMPELGRWFAKRDAGTFFKFVMTLASMEVMARRCPLFWKQHCDTGTLECTAIDVTARRAEAVLRDFPELRAVHCHMVGGWVEAMCEAAGARGMRVRKTACASKGAPMCRFEGEWLG